MMIIYRVFSPRASVKSFTRSRAHTHAHTHPVHKLVLLLLGAQLHQTDFFIFKLVFCVCASPDRGASVSEGVSAAREIV